MNLFLSKLDWKGLPNKREKIIFIVAILVFAFGFFKSCAGPSFRAISTIKEEMTEAKQNREEIVGALGVKEGQKTKIQKWNGAPEKREKYNAMAHALIQNSNIILMKELSNPVITGDVKIDNINLPDPLPEEGVIKQPWKMNIFASFISVGEYIERLENMPILMTIDRIKIMSAGDIYGHVNAELEGTAYGW